MLKIRTGSIIILFLIVFGILPYSNEANAIFKVNETIKLKSPEIFPEKIFDTPIIVESGRGKFRPVSSMGKNLPVKIALGQVMPENWKIGNNSQSSLLAKRVTWEASNDSLKNVLELIGNRHQIRFFINWDRKEVTVLPLKEMSKPQKLMVKQPSIKLINPEIVGQTIKEEPKEPTFQTSSEDQEEYKKTGWNVKSGSLRKQLESWCIVNKWTLVWNSVLPDYILVVSATFSGEFEQTVDEAFLVLRKTSDCALKPRFYKGNDVLEIKDI